MKVKVQCPCGARFEFEVEPVNERMPVAIACPVCNADDTELANTIIREQSAAAIVGVAAAPVLPPTPPGPPPPAPAPPQLGLRIAKSPSAHSAPPASPAPAASAETGAPADSTVRLCPKHKGEPAVDACVVCGKPLCLHCMEQFGHVCSVFCRQQAEQKRIYIPAYAGQKSFIAKKANTRARLMTLAIGGGVLALLGVWFWYAWFAREPKIVYTVTLGSKNEAPEQRAARPAQYFKLVAPGQLLTIKNKEVSLLDVAKQQPIWTTPLPSDSKEDAKSAGKKIALEDLSLDEDFGFYNPQIMVGSNDLWLAFPNRVIRLDRQTGSIKDNPIHGHIASLEQQENSLVAVFVDPAGQRTLARVSLQDGTTQTTPLSAPAEIKPVVRTAAAKKAATPAAPALNNKKRGAEKIEQARAIAEAGARGAATGTITPDDSADASPDEPDDFMSYGFGGGQTPRYTASGSSVVQFQGKLLEKKTITHEAMKPKGKSVLDGNVTASQGLDLAQEMMNDSQRSMTGGVETEDVSRYQVTLHRWFGDNAPDWTGEVTGPPRFYALKTVDLVIAGQTVIAFDHHNKKLWDGKLSYPMHYPGERAPVLETKDAVLVADPGVLTCFDLVTGVARWRVNSVGISSLHTDDPGKIYLATTDAGPEKIKYSQQHNIHERIHPVIMKVDPASGKVLWRDESLGDKCYYSGKFIYSTWVTQTQSALKFEEGPDSHFNLYLLSPSSGGVIWNFHVDNQHIYQTEVRQNWILLRFENKLYVLKFFSL